MKHLLAAIILCFIANFTYAQEQADFRCIYSYSYLYDLLDGKQRKDEMMLLIGKQHTFFTSYLNFVADSLRVADPYNYAPEIVTIDGIKSVVPPRNRANRSLNKFRILIARNEGKLTEEAKFVTVNIHYTEALKPLAWKILTDTCQVLGYTCQKATSSYRGRAWTVWFTPDIAIGEGPWELRGLPGLILKAEDAKKEHSFECVAFERMKDATIDLSPHNESKPVKKGEYIKMEKLYHDDPLEFMNKFTIGKSFGATNSPKRKYNPLGLTL